jgi:hypothetical protein
MITRADAGQSGMVCVDCKAPVVDLRNNQVKSKLRSRITVVLFLLMFAGLPAILGANTISAMGSQPFTEHAGAE